MRFSAAVVLSYLATTYIPPTLAKGLPDEAPPLPEPHPIDEPMDEIGANIVGGEPADAGEFKFMVSWHRSFSLKPSCGGSLVAPNLVLSAAHCSGINGGVRVGSINARGYYNGDDGPPGVQANVAEKIVHPQYNFPNNDVMLLRLDQDIDTDIYPPIDLNFDPTEPVDSDGNGDGGDMLTVIGFGTLSSGGSQPNELLKVDVPYINHSSCNSMLFGQINEVNMLCAGYYNGGKDACQGDSGGPIFETIDGVVKQVGVVSWGYGCAAAELPGVYARVSGLQDWLKWQICDLSSDPKPGYCNADDPTASPTSAPVDPTASPTSAPVDPTASPTSAPITPEPTPSPVVNDAPSSIDTPIYSPVDGPPENPYKLIFDETFEDEDGTGQYEVTKVKNRVRETSFAYGDHSFRLRKSQNVVTRTKTVKDYSSLKFEFKYYSQGLEDGEKITLESKFNGSPWTKEQEWVKGIDFDNDGRWDLASVTIPVDDKKKVKFRIKEFADEGRGAGRDEIFLDQMHLWGLPKDESERIGDEADDYWKL